MSPVVGFFPGGGTPYDIGSKPTAFIIDTLAQVKI